MDILKNKKQVILLSGILVVLLTLIIILVINNKSIAKVKASDVKDLVSLQYELEQAFSSEDYSINNPNIIVNPYGNSPLSALVIFETNEEVTPRVTIIGKDELTTFTHTFDKTKVHYLPIYGLYADKDNEVVIEFGNTKKTIHIKTDKLPDDFTLPTKIEKDETKLTNDLYFFTPASQGYTTAYDVNGDVRWYLTNLALWKIDRLKNGHLLVSTERLIHAPYYNTGLYEIDLLGKIYNEYSLEGGYHHDYFEMENGNLLIASDDFNNEAGTVEDVVVEVNRNTGEVVKTYNLRDVLNMQDGKSENWVVYDWFHNNSVWYDLNTNSIILSGRHQDAVISIDYTSGELNWIIGDPTNWSEDYQKYFFTPVGGDFEWQWSQHAAMITPEGYVFIFDNGNNKSKIKSEYVDAENSYSRGVMYKIDTDEMTIEQVWQYGKERGSDYYSPYISDVDYLSKDHYIIHSGGISYKDGKVLNVPAGLGEADTLKSVTTELIDDEVVFEITLPTNNYRVEKMSLYSNDTFTLGNANRLGSLGETDVTSKVFGLKNSKEIDSVYQSYNISIKKEIDRLSINGQFKKGEELNIVLYNNFNSRNYNVIISKRTYTALCVDIFSDEKDENLIDVTKFINDEGLSGKYSILIEINGVLYNTNEYVEF